MAINTKLFCPAQDWDSYVSYEGTWGRQLCEPEPEPVEVFQDRLKKAESRVSWLEFQIYAARKTLSPRFGK
jgi:hypothetical protein